MISVPKYSDLLGKRFEYGGRGPDSFDCYGLAVELYKRAEITLPDYSSDPDNEFQANGFADGADRYFERVAKPEVLDIILFQIIPRFVTHCGVYVGYGKFVHITSKISVSCEPLNSIIWKDKQRGIYRFKGLSI